MNQFICERILRAWKSTLIGLLLLAGAIYVATSPVIQPSEKAYLVTLLGGGGVWALGLKKSTTRPKAKPRKP